MKNQIKNITRKASESLKNKSASDKNMLLIKQLKNQITELKKFKNAAKDNESKYRSLFELSDDAILVIENNTFVECNKAVVKMLGYKNKKELLNTHPSELSPEKQPDGRFSYEKAQEMISLAIKNGSHHFEWTHTRANGEDFPVEVWLSSFKYKRKTLINTIWRDLTEKKKTEQTILKNIEEKETLLKEIHHRVKNNLQIISSLLNLQSNNVNNNFVANILNQSKARIESMCKVHEMLYKSESLSKINYNDYLKELVSKLITNVKSEKHNVGLKINAPVNFNINTAIPLGLIINEVVTNALKYGITGNMKGVIYIDIKEKRKKYIMQIGDNGKGFPENISIDNSDTLGFQLITSLTEQLNGNIQRIFLKKGTHYQLTFESI